MQNEDVQQMLYYRAACLEAAADLLTSRFVGLKESPPDVVIAAELPQASSTVPMQSVINEIARIRAQAEQCRAQAYAQTSLLAGLPKELTDAAQPPQPRSKRRRDKRRKNSGAELPGAPDRRSEA